MGWNKRKWRDLKILNGITLIALIVSIIVLLILAGVAISTLTGDNGIINQTTKAKSSSDIAGAKEELELAVGALKIDKISGNIGGTVAEYVENHIADFKKALGNDNVNIENGVITYKEKEFDISEDGSISLSVISDNTQQEEDTETSNPNVFTYNVLNEAQKTAEITGFDFDYLESCDNTFSDWVELVCVSDDVHKIVIPKEVKLSLNDSNYSYNENGEEYTVTKIGDYAFNMDDGIISCLYDPTKIDIVLPNTLTYIGDNAFNGWDTSDINIPNSLTHIGSYAFSNTAIKNIIIPLTLTDIGEEAFGYCRAILESLVAPFGYINRNAFLNLTIQTEIESINIIGDTLGGAYANLYIDYSDSYIEEEPFELYIPTNITNISSDAFDEVYDQFYITYQGTKAQWEQVNKNGIDFTNITVHCSDGTY